MENGRFARIVETAWMMVVHGPAAVCDKVIEASLGLNVILGEDVVAEVATGFAFTREEADPVEHPIVGLVVAMVFDVIPYTEGDGEETVADNFGVTDGIIFSAQFDPPEIVESAESMPAIGKSIVSEVFIGPDRWNEWLGGVCFASLNKA